MKIYTIAYADDESGGTIATFANEADRDATWAAISAIPWRTFVANGKTMYERDIEIGGRSYNDCGAQPKSWLYKWSADVADGPMLVVDRTKPSAAGGGR